MKHLIFQIFILLCVSSSAQTIGRVVEIKNKHDTVYISDVMIYSIKTKQLTYTDSTGFFFFTNIPPEDTFDVVSMGYVRQKYVVKNPDDKILIRLKPAVNLDEIEIVYQRPSVEYSVISPLQVQTLNENYLQKAACCNLSESFETNASIDVQITDAITGIRQIQMNGVAGKYILLTKENMPYLFGIQTSRALSFLPGPFLQSIQLSKGVGAVLNGYESFVGQINTELWHPAKQEFKLYFNGYINQNARNEYNLIYHQKLSSKISSNIMLHASFNPLKEDLNEDGFVDIPIGQQINIVHKYSIKNERGLDWQFGGQIILDDKKSGQIIMNKSYPYLPYVVTATTRRYDVFSKSGWIFRQKPGHSAGLQLLYSYYDNKNQYGNNEYNAIQYTVYANFIYQGIIHTSAHTYKIGMNYNFIQPEEKYRYFSFFRQEEVTGIFIEYNYVPSPSISFLLGNRLDYHNYYRWIYTPRVHLKWNFNNQKTTFKLSAGKAFRTPNPLSENIGVMASNRLFYFTYQYPDYPYGLDAEKAWTLGGNLFHQFKLFHRPANVLLEYYYTFFTSQVVTDMDTATQVRIYNTKKAFAQSSQIEWQFQPIKRFETHIALRYVEQKTHYHYGMNLQPYIPKYRGFINMVYTTRNKKWNVDLTIQYISEKRLPYTSNSPIEYQRREYSPAYWNIVSQITYSTKWKNNEFKIYIGGENINDFKQNNPIVAAENPYSPYFDASMVWAPIYGRMLYAGIRYYWR